MRVQDFAREYGLPEESVFVRAHGGDVSMEDGGARRPYTERTEVRWEDGILTVQRRAATRVVLAAGKVWEVHVELPASQDPPHPAEDDERVQRMHDVLLWRDLPRT